MKRLSPFAARMTMAIASLVGLFASAYLFYTYVTGAPIACGIVSGCEVVRASEWAYTFGIPRPLLGMLFYTGLFGLLVARVATGWRTRHLYWLTMLAAAIGFIESGFLFLVQWLDIKAFCFWCLMSAVAATVIAAVAWFDRVEATREVSASRELRAYFVSLLVFLPIAFFGFVYLVQSKKPSDLPSETTISTATTSTTGETSVSKLVLLDGTPTTGSILSNVLVVEFADFQCPACGAFHPTMKRIREEYAGRVRFAFRHFPLVQIHDRAMPAAIAAQCVYDQGKFWEYADALYADQTKLGDADLRASAERLGADLKKYDSCIADTATKQIVERSMNQSAQLGMRFTPTILVNRTRVEQALTYEDFKTLIEKALSGSR